MNPRPLIFISAVSRELKSARQLVANTLTFLGYDPIWQDIFETSEGDLRGVLRKQISRCKGVVQLVGCCYGAEPPQPTEEFGRVSYTQYEALYARKIGKKVWYLFLDEQFPSDACIDEPEELRALQTVYRNRLKADTHLYHPLTSVEGLEARVLKLRGDLMHLRKGVKRWATGVAILLLAGLAVNFWLLHWQRHTSQQMAETQQAVSRQSQQEAETRQAVASVSQEMVKLREGIVQYIQVEGKIREAQTETGLVRDQVYEQLGKQMNMNVALLREKLPQAAEQLKDAPSASPFERASAAYVANDYQEAERLALQAAVQARNATPTNNADVIRALKLAGFAAQKQIKYAKAIAHLREAAELTNRERDPGPWAEIQHAIADVLIDQGQYREAATVLQGALEARANAFGPENPDTLRSRSRLAYVLWRQGRYRDAEAEFRKLIAVEERLLGAQDPETLASENGLANALDDEGKHADAESEHRHVLEARIKVLGPQNPETLKSRNNLALALNRQKKYVEAEQQFRELITVEERVLGPKHPETLRTRRNLLVTVGNQGRHEEAEKGFRALLAAQEQVLGAEHPDTLGVRNNIGYALAQQGRFADAEAQFRDVIRIETKVLGPEHPATLSSRMALAGVLSEQQKFGEADADCREVIALEEKVLGPEHPSTISSWHAFAYQLARQNKTEEAIPFARKAASAAEQVFGQDHPDTRKYAQLVQQLESQQPASDQASVKPVKAGMHEYNAAEARKHIGESATIVGKIDCIDHGRRHVDLQIGGCDLRKALVWIVVPNEASGPELDPETVRGVQIAVTGKIESVGGTPQITIKSTTQIQPRTALQTNYIGHAYDKEQQGDIDGAIVDLERAIEHQPARRDEACQHLAKLKEQKGDWRGALLAYERLIGFDPNKGGSYYVRATAKKQHGDFEGAMADFTRAAELRSSGISLVEIGKMRKANGDSKGATVEYDKAIAMLDSQIAGAQKPSDRLDLLYYHRGYAKELKGDVDGAVGDYSQAIVTKPSYEAGAYSRRGDIKKARGDLSGAISDYEYAVKYAQLPEDKEKLDKARAEAKTGAKKLVVAQPSIQAAEHEQSFNKGEVTLESIAEAFVQAHSGADVDAVAGLYADRIDYTNSGVISNAAVRAQAKEYFARWPVRQWSLVGPVKTISLGATKQKVIFSASYDASDPQTNKHASGIAQETLILASDKSGAIKIVSQKEQISKGNRSQFTERASNDRGLNAAKAEYEASSQDEAARLRYVVKLADIYYQLLQIDWATGQQRAMEDGDLVLDELAKHPATTNSDSKTLSQLLVGDWASPRHGNPYTFSANGKWGRSGSSLDDNWQIKGNEYFARDATGKIDEGGPIILLDSNYFIYGDGQGVSFYVRAHDSEAERNQSADTSTQNAAAEVNSTSNDKGDKPSDSAIEQKQLSMAKDVSIIVVPSPPDARKIGNVKVTFTDGHSEVLTHTGDCYNGKVSPKGNVGWIRVAKMKTISPSVKAIALNNDSLVLRLPDGRIKKFPPFDENRFIEDWTFAADDKTVILRSMGYHGPSSFVQYDLASGKVIDSRGTGYTPYAKLPPWAKPLAHPDE